MRELGQDTTCEQEAKILTWEIRLQIPPRKGHARCPWCSCPGPQRNGSHKSDLTEPFGRLHEVMPVEALYQLSSALQWGLNDWKPWALPMRLFLVQLPMQPRAARSSMRRPILSSPLQSYFLWILRQAVMGRWTETCKTRQLGTERLCGICKLGRKEAEECFRCLSAP